MGLFDIFQQHDAEARGALEQAAAGRTDAVTGLIERVLALGLDGKGFYKGAAAIGEAALTSADGDAELAIRRLASRGGRIAAGGGFVTSVGGFAVMPVAIPANVFEFYVTATRTAGAIAHVRGYDVTDPTVRTAVLLTLVGSGSNEILDRAGIAFGTGALSGLAARPLPAAARMMIQKAVGLRLLKSMAERTLVRFGRLVPLLGGLVGAIADWGMLRIIVSQARVEFPARVNPSERDWGVA